MIRLRVSEEPVTKLKTKDDTYQVETSIAFEANKPFLGEYEYTPTEETQVISIDGKKATSNIVINPIPNNYGKVTWNGAVLTVE